MKKIYAFALSAVVAAFAGCKDIGAPNHASVDSGTSRSNRTSAVVIGMENSRFAGSCPGAKYDAERMRSLIGRYTADVACFYDSMATHDAVAAAMERAVKADLCIIYYSGHGGSGRFADTDADEADGMDEYLCLYDRGMRDNEIWAIVSRAKGRVFLVFDCCHSQTMFRVPCITLGRVAESALGATHSASGGIDMLCWSGCPDNTYSYGSDRGGELTNAILRHYSAAKTYDGLWSAVESDAQLRRFEDVQRTVMGHGFGSERVFR